MLIDLKSVHPWWGQHHCKSPKRIKHNQTGLPRLSGDSDYQWGKSNTNKTRETQKIQEKHTSNNERYNWNRPNIYSKHLRLEALHPHFAQRPCCSRWHAAPLPPCRWWTRHDMPLHQDWGCRRTWLTPDESRKSGDIPSPQGHPRHGTSESRPDAKTRYPLKLLRPGYSGT